MNLQVNHVQGFRLKSASISGVMMTSAPLSKCHSSASRPVSSSMSKSQLRRHVQPYLTEQETMGNLIN